MPDCTAVLLPQWSDEWLGEPTTVAQKRLGITLAAMHLNSRNVYYWEDAHRLLLEHGFTRESERLFLLLPNHEMRFMRPELVCSLAAQKRFRSAAFWLEFNLVDYLRTAPKNWVASSFSSAAEPVIKKLPLNGSALQDVSVMSTAEEYIAFLIGYYG